MALAVSVNVSDGLSRTAVNEAIRNTEAVITGLVDPMMNGSLTSQTPAQEAQINAELEQLVGSRQLLRIKVWSPEGQVVYSDLPALRGLSFPLADDLEGALDGATSAEFSQGTDVENLFEHGLAPELLSIYLPIQGSSNGDPIGVYEVYEDAGPIVSEIESTRSDVLFIVGGTGLALMLVLFLGFAGASRLLSRQNQMLKTSERRFRSLVQNSTDVNMIVSRNGKIAYEGSAVERVLRLSGRGARGPIGLRGGGRRRSARSAPPLVGGPAQPCGRSVDGSSGAPRRRVESVARSRHAQPV